MKKKITKRGHIPLDRISRKRPHSSDSEEEAEIEQCTKSEQEHIQPEKQEDKMFDFQKAERFEPAETVSEKVPDERPDEPESNVLALSLDDSCVNEKVVLNLDGNLSDVSGVLNTPGRPHDQNNTPRRSHDQNNTPGRPHDQNNTPRRSHDQNNTPRRSHDQNNTPRRSHDQNNTPGRPHDQNNTPRRSHDQNNTPRRSHDQNNTPRRSHDQNNTPRRSHDQNNNSIESERQDTTRAESETMDVDENSRQSVSQMINQPGEKGKLGGVGTQTDSLIEYEDSTFSNDPGDRMIAINLYGTDTDNVQQDQHVTETPTCPPEGFVNKQQNANSYEQMCIEQRQTGMPQPTNQHCLLHTHQYPRHVDIPEYIDQRSSQLCYNVREESSMSVSNQGTSDPSHCGQEKITSFAGILRENSLAENYHEERRSTMTLPLTHSREDLDLADEDSHRQYPQTISYQQAHTSTVPNNIEDCNRSAEQLASELEQRYENRNAHMLSPGMLKHADGQQFGCDEFVQQSQELYTNHPQHFTKDASMQSTPKQGHHVENMYYHQSMSASKPVSFNSPEAFSTPDRNIQTVSSLNSQQTGHGSYTYNDVQLHGVKWSSNMDRGHDDPVTGNECSENPCSDHFLPPQRQQIGFNVLEGMESPTEIQRGATYQRQAVKEITKTTSTPSAVMETHLRQNVQYQKQNPSMLVHQVPETDRFVMREYAERPEPVQYYSHNQYGTPLKKRHRTGNNNGPFLQPPARPQIFMERMMPKFEEDFHPYQQARIPQPDYFVANPSDTTRMSSRALLCRYIDFLILENEQITEISKSVTPSCDVHVLENMTFMDTLKYNFPFPSKKFIKWVNFFFPKLNFWDVEFKGRKPMTYIENFTKMVDNRPTMELLREIFFFFQREATR